MKLLLAEDEVSLSEAVVDILTYHNYQVDAVYDGADAMAYARAESYDGMIFDVMMPKLDGFEVLKLLRGEGCRAEAYDTIEAAADAAYRRAAPDGMACCVGSLYMAGAARSYLLGRGKQE